jgi:hypothetical protein
MNYGIFSMGRPKQRSSPYRAVNTFRLCYKNQPVNAV